MEFIRFIPYNVNIQDDWKVAYSTWKTNLSTLLDMNDSLFINNTDNLPSLVDFINQVWDAQLDGERVDRTLLQYIFYIYMRLSCLPTSSNHTLLQTDLLIKLAVVYSSTNKLQLREAMKVFTEKLAPTLNMIIDLIDVLSHTELDRNVLKKAQVLTQTLDALVSATQPDFLDIDVLVTKWYADLIPCFKKAVEKDSSLSSYAYVIKRSLVSIFQTYLEMRFFQPLGHTVDDTGNLILIGKAKNESKAIEFLALWIEKSEIKRASAFVDAPLIMDWESAYDISIKIGQINSTLFSNENDMLQILEMQMEQVRFTITNEESWQVEEDDKEQKMIKIREVLGDVSDDVIENYLDANNNDADAVILNLLKDGSQSALSNRKNIYDNDEFDVFTRNTINKSKVYTGKKDKGDADNLLDDKSSIDKSDVLKRVVDMYEDEEENDYNDSGEPSGVATEGQDAQDFVKQKSTYMDPGIQHESLLVSLFTENPDVLARNSTARKLAKRIELRKKTGMSDEQIEGWAIMLGRNPRKQRILDKYMLFDGNQTELTKNKPGPQASQTPPSKKSIAKDQSYKDKNKARFGNHNRKNMRDKKLSKLGPPPS